MEPGIRVGGSAGLCLALALAVASLLASPARSFRFDLQSGKTKCMIEDIKLGSMSVGKYTVVNPADSGPLPDSHRVSAHMASPHGRNIHKSEKVESGNFAFTASEEGTYFACFATPDHQPPTTVTLEFEWRTGVDATDWPNIAKKGQIKVMEQELMKLEDTVKSIHDEMLYLHDRESELQELNRTTNSRMAWLSFLSLAVCLSVAGLQLWHLKTFFERKKLL